MTTMVTIGVKIDKEFFDKMRTHKLKIELDAGRKYNWGEYVKILFGMALE